MMPSAEEVCRAELMGGKMTQNDLIRRRFNGLLQNS